VGLKKERVVGFKQEQVAGLDNTMQGAGRGSSFFFGLTG
jgi:hypothetical protein